MYLRVLYDSESKQIFFPQTGLTNWSIFFAVGIELLNIIHTSFDFKGLSDDLINKLGVDFCNILEPRIHSANNPLQSS